MNLTRRSFFGGAIALAAVSQLPRFIPSLPRIYCDGIHCDADGFEALMENRPFEVSEVASKNFLNRGTVYLASNVRLSLGRTLTIRQGKIFGSDIRITALAGFSDEIFIHLHDGAEIVGNRFTMDWSKRIPHPKSIGALVL